MYNVRYSRTILSQINFFLLYLTLIDVLTISTPSRAITRPISLSKLPRLVITLKIGNLELAEAADARAAKGGGGRGGVTGGGGGGGGGGVNGGKKKSGLPNIQLRNSSGRPL